MINNKLQKKKEELELNYRDDFGWELSHRDVFKIGFDEGVIAGRDGYVSMSEVQILLDSLEWIKLIATNASHPCNRIYDKAHNTLIIWKDKIK